MNNPEQVSGFLRFDEFARAQRLITQQANEQAFQTEEVIGNPFAELNAERTLTPSEQTILWANQVLEEYNSLPKTNARERRKARDLVAQTARRLVQNPQDIDTAGSVWKSRESVSDSRAKPADTFYETIKRECALTIKEKWRDVTPEQLAQLVKTYANSVLTQNFAHDLLVSYFRGPQGMVNRVKSLYGFVYGLMDFAVSDGNFLKTGIKIARFESDILRSDSAFRLDMHVASNAVDDDEALGKKMAIDTVVASLSKLAGYDKANIDSFLTVPDSLENQMRLKIENYSQRIVKKFGKEEGLRRLRVLGYLYRSRILQDSSESKESKRNEWPFYLIFGEDNHLKKRFDEEIAIWMILDTIRSKMEERMIQQHGSGVKLLSIARQDGLISNIILPNITSEQTTNRIARDALMISLSEEDQIFINGEGVRCVNKEILSGDIQIQCII